MRVLIIGGHFTPALAVIEALPPEAHLLYVGRKTALEGEKTLSLEYQILTKRKIPFAEITTGRFQRKWTNHSFASILKIPIGFWQAFRIIKTFRPTIILGFGGYVQVPICLVGFLLRIPIVIHEQTLEAGLANRVIAPFATKICISWQSSSNFFNRNKIALTGNPAVSEIFSHKIPSTEEISNRHRLVIVGGSQGSHAINMLVSATLGELVKYYTVFHQTGDAKEFHDFDNLTEKKDALSPLAKNRYTLVKFVDPKDIVSIFAQADLIISRAGMNTITTLLVMQKQALLIPLPHTQHDEQRKNALFFKAHGKGQILLQQNATPEQFLQHIHDMINQKGNSTNQKPDSDILLHKDAAKNILTILTYAQKSSTQT